MSVQLILVCAFIATFGVALFLASKEGSKAARLEALKAELKKQAEEQQRAQQITDHVYSLSADDTRKRLHEIANQQR